MKTTRILLSALLILITIGSGFSSIRRTLIDFAKYDNSMKQQFPDPAESYITNDNGVQRVVLGYQEYLLDNWRIELNSSSDDIKNRIQSYCKSVESRQYGPTLGIRIHFPKWNANSMALVKPPFPIKIYDTNGQYANTENGVMPNVAELKSMSVWVNGRNYRYNLAIRTKNRMEEVQEYYFGSLLFDGWRRLTYINPNFTDRIQSKVLQREPLYPYDIPYLVLDSIAIFRPNDTVGGDFVTYIRSIDMEYTPYVIDSDADDIKDEAVWGIITDRNRRRMDIENRRLTEEMYLFQQEKKRMQAAGATNN